jgi:hypothetical protein
MHRLSWVAGVVALASGVAGCGEPPLDGFGDTVRTYSSYDYPHRPTGRLTSGPKFLQSVMTEIGTIDHSPEDELAVAVSILLDDHMAPGRENFWAGACAPGRRVEAVELGSVLVTVRLDGEVPRRETCVLTATERSVREQQLAWTVTHELDPFGEHEPPAVRLVEPDGEMWEVVADPAYLEPHDRPTRGAAE